MWINYVRICKKNLNVEQADIEIDTKVGNSVKKLRMMTVITNTDQRACLGKGKKETFPVNLIVPCKALPVLIK